MQLAQGEQGIRVVVKRRGARQKVERLAGEGKMARRTLLKRNPAVDGLGSSDLEHPSRDIDAKELKIPVELEHLLEEDSRSTPDIEQD